jgi:hypothetical protein
MLFVPINIKKKKREVKNKKRAPGSVDVGGRGRFGMKDITSHIKIMSDKVYSNKINKQFNHTVLSELSLPRTSPLRGV